MKRLSISILIAATLLMGFGCVHGGTTQPVISPQTPDLSATTSTSEAPIAFAWKSVGDGVERGEMTVPQGDFTAHLIAYRFDPKIYQFHFVQAKEPTLISMWMHDESKAVFVMNGVYFQDDHSPAGKLRIDGKNIGTRSYDATKSGVIVFDGNKNQIIDTSVDTIKDEQVPNMAQSYPFLLKNGTVAIKEDSGQASRRSFVGMDKDGKMIFGAFVGGQISLYGLAQQLSSLPVQWANVLNVDGGSSTGFSANINGTQELEDSYVDIPNVIEVEKK